VSNHKSNSLESKTQFSLPFRGALRSIAVHFPDQVRTNGWWEEHYPDLIANAREATLAKVWANFQPETASIYDQAIAPYLKDPFRGTVARRVMGPEDSAQEMSVAAGQGALDAAGLEAGDIDMMLVNALRPDSHVVGDAAFLVGKLGLRAPAIDFESACSSAVVGFHMACDLVSTGRYKRILVVVCCTYTRDIDLSDSFSWFLGDGAAAFVVERVDAGTGEGLLGAHTIPTVSTCGAFAYELEDVDGVPALRIHANKKKAGQSIRDGSERFLRECVDGALSQAGVSLSEIDFLICNTPTAWYAEFCANALGLPMSKTIDNYPEFANCGPALWPNNLHTALRRGSISPGDLVLGYSVGSVSTASAVVLRVGDVAVG